MRLDSSLGVVLPILHVRALPQADTTLIKPALKKACIAIADIYRCSVDQVTATWEEVKPGWFIEGARSAPAQQPTTHAPIAELICFEGRTQEEIEEMLLVTSRILSQTLNLGENIFVRYVEYRTGQAVNGSAIVRK